MQLWRISMWTAYKVMMLALSTAVSCYWSQQLKSEINGWPSIAISTVNDSTTNGHITSNNCRHLRMKILNYFMYFTPGLYLARRQWLIRAALPLSSAGLLAKTRTKVQTTVNEVHTALTFSSIWDVPLLTEKNSGWMNDTPLHLITSSVTAIFMWPRVSQLLP